MTPLYDRHIHDFCDYVLLELKGKYMSHWRMNLIFTAYYLDVSIQIDIPPFNSFSSAISKLFAPDIPVLTNTFQQLLNKTDEGLIISKAAMYCLKYLSDRSHTRKDTQRYIRVQEMYWNSRRLRPWRWHRRRAGLCRDIAKTPILFNNVFSASSRRRLSLTTYGRLFAREYFQLYAIYTVHSRPWDHWESESHDGHYAGETLHKYCALMEYLSNILPRAGRFRPLIHFCRTKSFAPMSIIFPDQSRRARRAIEAYLCRMDTGVDDDDGKISQNQIVTL